MSLEQAARHAATASYRSLRARARNDTAIRSTHSMTLLSYLLRRLVGFVAVMIGISIITFGLSHLVPADPAIVALGDHATDEQIEAFREKYGLNKPVPEQYWIYVTNLLRGDLGISLRTRRPVADDLRNFFPATFELSLTALILSILIGIPAGVVSATARNRLPDHIVRILSLIGGSVPIFWLGLILIGFFYGRLGWLPGGARIDSFIPPPPRSPACSPWIACWPGTTKHFGAAFIICSCRRWRWAISPRRLSLV